MRASRRVISSVSVTTLLTILSATVIRFLPGESWGQHIARFVRPSTGDRPEGASGPGHAPCRWGGQVRSAGSRGPHADGAERAEIGERRIVTVSRFQRPAIIENGHPHFVISVGQPFPEEPVDLLPRASSGREGGEIAIPGRERPHRGGVPADVPSLEDEGV